MGGSMSLSVSITHRSIARTLPIIVAAFMAASVPTLSVFAIPITSTPVATRTNTPTITPTVSKTPARAAPASPTVTPTQTPTLTPASSAPLPATPTPTRTPTSTATFTPTNSPTPLVASCNANDFSSNLEMELLKPVDLLVAEELANSNKDPSVCNPAVKGSCGGAQQALQDRQQRILSNGLRTKWIRSTTNLRP